MKRLEITATAERDLREISRYTDQRWGSTQRQRYLALLKERFGLLRQQSMLGRARDELGPGIRSLSSARHVIFYRESDERIQILRVLHGSMDAQRHFGPGTPGKASSSL